MQITFAEFFSPKGTITPKKYFVFGSSLFLLKYLIDRSIATFLFHKQWSLWSYMLPQETDRLLTTGNIQLYSVLLVIALPFIWSGTVLTIRRLRSCNLPVWLVILFFVPFINLLMFGILSVLPERSVHVRTGARRFSFHRLIPRSRFGSALLALIVNAISALVFTRFSVQTLNQYGWGLFVGFPFCLGLTSTLIYSYHEERDLGSNISVALLAIAIAGLALLAFAIEGILCLFMAAPLLAALAIAGAFVGYLMQFHPGPDETSKVFCVIALLLPGLMIVEKHQAPQPSILKAVTVIEINAPPQTVWQNVIAFSELPEPEELIFKAGIAYPVRAEINGTGPGAIRHCIFTTGSFVEPIEVWNEPQLLRFGVLKNPAPMQEWTPYDEIHPPHLEGFFTSNRGQFRLVPVSGNKTLLEGTTWYSHGLWPEKYWQLWSDYVIHRIHLRVLRHIKRCSETGSCA